MKKYFWLLTSLLIILTVTGCAAQAAQETLLPLGNAAWPTAQPAVARPSATPFPKISLADVTTPTPVITVNSPSPQGKAGAVLALPLREAAGEQGNGNLLPTPPAQAIEASLKTQSDAAPVSPAANAALAELAPVAMARIARGEVEIRPSYGTDNAPIDKITADREEIAILAVDTSRQFALVKPAQAKVGWAALSDLTLTNGSTTAAPTAFTAWTKSNEITLRQGPGIYYPAAGVLPINNLVVVVGLNHGHSWALIKPVLGSGSGWAQIQFLALSEPIAKLPPAPTLPVAEAAPPLDPAAAAASAKEGKLVVQLASGGDIMIVNADGSGLRRLTSGLDPALSPDGQQVAFTRWEQGEGANGSLWLINIDGSNEHQLMGFVKQPKGPEWSPDGQWIALNFQHEGRLDEKVVKVDLSKDRNPSVPWNAEEVKVEYEKVVIRGRVVGAIPFLRYTLPPDPHWSLRVVSVADGHFEDVDGGTYAFRPAWDPAQPWRLVSDGGRGLLAVDLNRPGEYRQNLTENLGDGSPVFSPDGRYIALTTGQPNSNGRYDIYRLNAAGGDRVRLTQTPLWVGVVPDEQRQWHNVSPAWSPDGSQIAYLTDRTDRWEIWVMNADGSNQRPLFADKVNQQLTITYNFVDERVLSWR